MPKVEIKPLLAADGTFAKDAAPLEEWPTEVLEQSIEMTKDRATKEALGNELQRRDQDPDQDPDDGAPAAPAPPPLTGNTDADLTAALATAQGAFPPIAKNHTATVTPKEGKQGYSYKYADLADVLAAVRPVLAQCGLAITQRTRHLEGSGKVELRTELRHVGGGQLESVVELGQAPSNPQQFGGALTYLRRYELVTLLGIAAEEDLDAAHVDPPDRQRSAAPRWTEPARNGDKAGALKVATEVLGHERTAKMWLASLSDVNGGDFPKGVAQWLGALPNWIAAGQKNAADDAAAAAEAAQPGPSGEEPDQPGPSGEEPDQAPDPTEAASEAVELQPGEGLADGLARAAAGDEEPGYEEVPPDAELTFSGDQAAPAPDSITMTPEAIAEHCICQRDGLNVTERNDQCPIKGHGIGF